MKDINNKKIIYLDAYSGISGDMFLGAMADIAIQQDSAFDLAALLKKIALDGYQVDVLREKRAGIGGVRARVTADDHHAHRHLSDIREIMEKSDLSEEVRSRANEAFYLLAEAEAKVHSTTPEEIHFHEVGAVDSIVDITGAMLMMEHLGWPHVLSSPVNVGSGTVKCAHGVLPVPAPATSELLKGMTVFSKGEPMERTTPTGALLLRVLAGEKGFRELPEGRIVQIGIGLGTADTKELPNILRASLFEPTEAYNSDVLGSGSDVPTLIETNIDDMNPQDFASVMEKLLAEGALDVWCENILMKKSRSAVKLCCLSESADTDRLVGIIMRDTTTLGVRITRPRRQTMERIIKNVHTSLGVVRVKQAWLNGKLVRTVPEHEDLLAIAKEKDMPIIDVRSTVLKEI